MRKKAGFTLLEIMVVVAILGILGASAVAFQTKYRQRTVGSEATLMMKQILDAEIMYFLAHDEFFPSNADSDEILVWNNGAPPSAADKQRALDALNVAIPVGHSLDFQIYRDPTDLVGSPVTVVIRSAGNFDLFPGVRGFYQTVDKTGKIEPPKEAL